eukprot:gnl/MRDRNA2_/MRDRNA2_99360_c0_seq1.p1 gnl/MRDRNA2_/MRDRNA2_99360_c0~~gnl/MRDRNA2_/MRDRNA2_99360_c0_seq1.p1  ORF type:complete len:641 (+),score=170.54 gnl/MRDRNA2_/MRDRNA2_99360_c0_seq1:130-2052(+)
MENEVQDDCLARADLAEKEALETSVHVHEDLEQTSKWNKVRLVAVEEVTVRGKDQMTLAMEMVQLRFEVESQRERCALMLSEKQQLEAERDELKEQLGKSLGKKVLTARLAQAEAKNKRLANKCERLHSFVGTNAPGAQRWLLDGGMRAWMRCISVKQRAEIARLRHIKQLRTERSEQTVSLWRDSIRPWRLLFFALEAWREQWQAEKLRQKLENLEKEKAKSQRRMTSLGGELEFASERTEVVQMRCEELELRVNDLSEQLQEACKQKDDAAAQARGARDDAAVFRRKSQIALQTATDAREAMVMAVSEAQQHRCECLAAQAASRQAESEKTDAERQRNDAQAAYKQLKEDFDNYFSEIEDVGPPEVDVFNSLPISQKKLSPGEKFKEVLLELDRQKNLAERLQEEVTTLKPALAKALQRAKDAEHTVDQLESQVQQLTAERQELRVANSELTERVKLSQHDQESVMTELQVLLRAVLNSETKRNKQVEDLHQALCEQDRNVDMLRDTCVENDKRQRHGKLGHRLTNRGRNPWILFPRNAIEGYHPGSVNSSDGFQLAKVVEDYTAKRAAQKSEKDEWLDTTLTKRAPQKVESLPSLQGRQQKVQSRTHGKLLQASSHGADRAWTDNAGMGRLFQTWRS